MNSFSTIPPLMGLRKDHKPDLEGDPVRGPKLRPLCLANMAPSAPLGSLQAKIVRALADEIQDRIQTEVISTEEIKYHIEKANISTEERVERHKLSNVRPRRTGTVSPLQDMGSTFVLSMDVNKQ